MMITLTWADLSWWHLWQLASLVIFTYLICRHGLGQVLAWCGTVMLYGLVVLVGATALGLLGYALSLLHASVAPQMEAMGLGEFFSALWTAAIILGGLMTAIIAFRWASGAMHGE